VEVASLSRLQRCSSGHGQRRCWTQHSPSAQLLGLRFCLFMRHPECCPKRFIVLSYFPWNLWNLFYPDSRSFNIDLDEHPVKYVATKFSESLCSTIYEWITQEIDKEGKLALPELNSVQIPEALLHWLQRSPITMNRSEPREHTPIHFRTLKVNLLVVDKLLALPCLLFRKGFKNGNPLTFSPILYTSQMCRRWTDVL